MKKKIHWTFLTFEQCVCIIRKNCVYEMNCHIYLSYKNARVERIIAVIQLKRNEYHGKIYTIARISDRHLWDFISAST